MNERMASLKNRSALPLAVLALGLATTGVLTMLFGNKIQARQDDQRDIMIEEIALSIEFRMNTYVQSLSGTRALFQASDEVTSADFNAYVESIGVLDDLPGMQAVGWNRLVLPDDVAAYEAAMRDQNPSLPAEYSVRPTTTDELMVVEYILPVEGNEQAFGFNIYSEARRATAIDTARATNRPAATAPINLVQDNAEVPGILVLLPTTTDGEIDGVAVAVFRTGDLLTAAADDIGRTFTVQDMGSVGSDTDEPILLSAAEIEADPSARAEIDIYGRRWLVTLGADNLPAPSPLGLLLGAASGIALSIALASVVRSTRQSARLAEHKAALLTEELVESNRELAIVGTRLEEGLLSADVLVWESNLTTGATWSSAGVDHPEAGIEDEFMQRLHPEDRAAFEETSDPAPGEASEYEFRLADKHGNYRWTLSRSHGVLRNGEHVVIGAHIDVTDQRERTDLVRDLNEDLTARNQSLRDFTHVASHDLRSPLRAVGSLVGFLREDLPTDLAEDAEHHLQRIDERVARMSQLIDDLLIYASAHNVENRTKMVRVSDVVEDILATIEIPDQIRTVVDCDIPPVTIARTPLSMCLRNLIDNALKHHDKANGEVAVSAHISNDLLHVAVKDNGPGIEAEYLTKIFEPFRRLRADEKSPGSGIGLSVIERATVTHNATIDVTSVVGEGSTFIINWPVAADVGVIDLVQASVNT